MSTPRSPLRDSPARGANLRPVPAREDRTLPAIVAVHRSWVGRTGIRQGAQCPAGDQTWAGAVRRLAAFGCQSWRGQLDSRISGGGRRGQARSGSPVPGGDRRRSSPFPLRCPMRLVMRGSQLLDSCRRPGVASWQASWSRGPAMGEITKRARRLRDRLAKRRSDRRARRGGRALKRNAAKAQRLSHERLDNKLPR